MQPTTIDPTIKALVSALGEAETGTSSPEAYAKRGASGEYGRYQFMPDTWKTYAQEAGVASPLEQSTIEDQNKVAYTKIKQWKDQGYNPAQIASMWNAGPDDPDAYKGTFSNGQPSTGTNSQGVQYNVPEYTKKVSAAYQRLKGQSAVLPAGGQPIPGAQPEETGFLGDVGASFATAGGRLSKAVGQGIEGQINPMSAILQSVGAGAGLVGDLTSNVLENTPIVKNVWEGITGLVGKGVKGFTDTEAGQGLIGNYQKWAQEHPEAAGNLGAGFDIATAIPVLKGLKVAKTSVKGGIKNVLHGKPDPIVEAVAKKLGPVGKSQALLERGTVKKGFLRKVTLADDPVDIEAARLIKMHVPKFNPNKLMQSTEEVKKVTKAMTKKYREEVIKSGADIIYPKKELMSKLRSIELPDLIASDRTLKAVYGKLLARVEKSVAESGGKLSNILKVLEDFDISVKRQFPNLYRSDTLTPMRQAVKDVRETIKTFAVDKLPNSQLKEQMLTVHKLMEANRNLAKNATSGATSELGKSFMDKHPVVKGLMKTGPRAVLEGMGAGGVIKLLD